MSAFCSQCGTALKPDARFCEECGTPIGSTTVKPSPGSVRESRSRVWLWLVGCFFALFVLVGAFNLQKYKISFLSGATCSARIISVGHQIYMINGPDAGYDVIVEMNNSGKRDEIWIEVLLSSSEGKWERQQGLLLNAGESRRQTYQFPEPTVSATNVQSTVTCYPRSKPSALALDVQETTTEENPALSSTAPLSPALELEPQPPPDLPAGTSRLVWTCVHKVDEQLANGLWADVYHGLEAGFDGKVLIVKVTEKWQNLSNDKRKTVAKLVVDAWIKNGRELRLLTSKEELEEIVLKRLPDDQTVAIWKPATGVQLF